MIGRRNKPNVCLVLREGVSLDDVERVARAANWNSIMDKAGDEKSPRQKAWRTSNGSVRVDYIEDPWLHVCYVRMTASHLDLAREGGEQFARAVRVWTQQQVRDSLADAETSAEKLAAVARLAVTSGDTLDLDVMRGFRTLARDDAAEVRRTTLFAMNYPAWPAFRNLIVDLSQTDPDPALRELAASLLERPQWRRASQPD